MKLRDEQVLKSLTTTLKTLVNYEVGREKQGNKDAYNDGGRDAVVETVATRIFNSMSTREDNIRKQAILHVITLLFADKIAVATEKMQKGKKGLSYEEAEKRAKVTLTVADINKAIKFVWEYYDQKDNGQTEPADSESKN